MNDDIKIYYIPANFIKEGRIFQGRIRLWYLVDAVILGLCGVFAGLLLTILFGTSADISIVLLILLGSVFFLVGYTGFNGDRIFVVMKSAKKWRAQKVTMLKNPRPRYLKQDPVEALIHTTSLRDVMAGKIEEKLSERREIKSTFDMQDGKDYYFRKDEFIDRYAVRPKKLRPARQYGADDVLELTDDGSVKE